MVIDVVIPNWQKSKNSAERPADKEKSDKRHDDLMFTEGLQLPHHHRQIRRQNGNDNRQKSQQKHLQYHRWHGRGCDDFLPYIVYDAKNIHDCQAVPHHQGHTRCDTKRYNTCQRAGQGPNDCRQQFA